MALRPLPCWGASVDIPAGLLSDGPLRLFVIRGADGVIKYTFQQLRTTARPEAGAFVGATNCPGSPFTLSTDLDFNRFPDGDSPWKPLPGGSSTSSDPSVRITSGPVPATGVLIEARGNDGQIHRTVFDMNCDGTFMESVFDSPALGFGDADRDGWPSSTSSSSPWRRIGAVP
jgi:hypothetical protein